MSQTGAKLEQLTRDFLQDGSSGLNAQCGAIEARDGVTLDRVRDEAWYLDNVPLELIYEVTDQPDYPHVLIYVDSSDNAQLEKFRYFAGTHALVVELRISVEGAEQIASLAQVIHRYVEAVMNCLQARDRDWNASGFTYGGRYRVSFGQVGMGGENYVKTAKIMMAVQQRVGTP